MFVLRERFYVGDLLVFEHMKHACNKDKEKNDGFESRDVKLTMVVFSDDFIHDIFSLSLSLSRFPMSRSKMTFSSTWP